MNIASQYYLDFYISNMPGFIPKPSIGVRAINGSVVNQEIASFLEPNGIEFIEHIKNEINSFDYNLPLDDYDVWGFNYTESLRIRCNPPNPAVVVFNTGGTEVLVPVNDFLEILEEWKAFVASVPTPHWLENR